MDNIYNYNNTRSSNQNHSSLLSFLNTTARYPDSKKKFPEKYRLLLIMTTSLQTVLYQLTKHLLVKQKRLFKVLLMQTNRSISDFIANMKKNLFKKNKSIACILIYKSVRRQCVSLHNKLSALYYVLFMTHNLHHKTRI